MKTKKEQNNGSLRQLIRLHILLRKNRIAKNCNMYFSPNQFSSAVIFEDIYWSLSAIFLLTGVVAIFYYMLNIEHQTLHNSLMAVGLFFFSVEALLGIVRYELKFKMSQDAAKLERKTASFLNSNKSFDDIMGESIEWFLKEFGIETLYFGIRNQNTNSEAKYNILKGEPPLLPIIPENYPDNYIQMCRGPQNELVFIQHIKHDRYETTLFMGIPQTKMFWKILRIWFTKDAIENCYHLLEERYVLSERGLDIPLVGLQRKYIDGNFDENPDYDISVIYRPKYEIGGDVYLLQQQNHYVVGLADVSGKGLGAATMVPLTQYIMERETRNASVLVDAASNFEKELCAQVEDTDMFVTAVLGVLYSDRFEYCRFGHEAVTVYRSKNNTAGAINRNKVGVIGALPSCQIPRCDTLDIDTGDIILLYTDGAIDNKNKKTLCRGNSHWIASMLKHYAKLSAKEITQNLYEEIVDFAGTNSLADDLTLIVIKKK